MLQTTGRQNPENPLYSSSHGTACYWPLFTLKLGVSIVTCASAPGSFSGFNSPPNNASATGFCEWLRSYSECASLVFLQQRLNIFLRGYTRPRNADQTEKQRLILSCPMDLNIVDGPLLPAVSDNSSALLSVIGKRMATNNHLAIQECQFGPGMVASGNTRNPTSSGDR